MSRKYSTSNKDVITLDELTALDMPKAIPALLNEIVRHHHLSCRVSSAVRQERQASIEGDLLLSVVGPRWELRAFMRRGGDPDQSVDNALSRLQGMVQ